MTHFGIASFGLGQKVRHIHHAFYGVVLDVDAQYRGDVEEIGWIDPEQPFYSIMVEIDDGTAIVYAAQEALVLTEGVPPLSEQETDRLFNVDASGRHAPRVHVLQ